MSTKEAKKEDGDAADAPPPKSKKLLIIIVGASVIVLSLGAGIGYLMGHKTPPPAAAAGEAAAGEHGEAKPPTAEKKAEKKDEHKKPPVFLALEPFTVNLQPDSAAGEQFLQVVVSLRAADDKKAEEVRTFMPQIRHEILTIAGAQKASEIKTPEGRELLAEDIKDAVNEVLGYEPPKRNKRKTKEAEPAEDVPILAVFFTQFIVQ